MVRVKICGIMEPEHAAVAAKAGADFIGVVFAPSERRITPEIARQVFAAARNANPKPEMVGVFVNAPVEEVNRIAEECGLDRVQLSGDETLDYCRQVSAPVIKVLHIPANVDATVVFKQAEEWYNAMERIDLHGGKHKDFLCLLDSAVEGVRGGTGRSFDWLVAKEIAYHYPVIIAGGLTVENVARVVREVQPWGIDVSSGVETNGRKDPAKIEAFIRSVWNAE